MRLNQPYLLILLILLFKLNSYYAQLCLGPAQNYSFTPASAVRVCSGDLNGDSKLDLVTANGFWGWNTLTLLLGTGSGGFGSATTLSVPAGSQPQDVCVVDLNNDGKADIVSANQASNTVSVLLGTGTGTFGAPTNFAVGTSPVSVIGHDFNADGNADLAVANEGFLWSVSILIGNGAGGFGAPASISLSESPMKVISADFNKDGKPDLVTANGYNGGSTVSVILGTGTGNFGAATNFTVGMFPLSLCAEDFNLDGNLDIATANDSSYVVAVMLGTGSGSFGPVNTYTVAYEPISIVTADFNGDCFPDIATASNSDYIGTEVKDISVILGTGTGAFGPATLYTWSFFPQCITTGDYDGNGKPDIVVVGDTTNISVYLNCSAGSCGEGIMGSFILQRSSVFPNPATDHIAITIPANIDVKQVTLVIKNSLGAIVKQCGFTSDVDVRELPGGYYVAEIKIAGKPGLFANFIKE
jgi:hypothetical protein